MSSFLNWTFAGINYAAKTFCNLYEYSRFCFRFFPKLCEHAQNYFLNRSLEFQREWSTLLQYPCIHQSVRWNRLSDITLSTCKCELYHNLMLFSWSRTKGILRIIWQLSITNQECFRSACRQHAINNTFLGKTVYPADTEAEHRGIGCGTWKGACGP